MPGPVQTQNNMANPDPKNARSVQQTRDARWRHTDRWPCQGSTRKQGSNNPCLHVSILQQRVVDPSVNMGTSLTGESSPSNAVKPQPRGFPQAAGEETGGLERQEEGSCWCLSMDGWDQSLRGYLGSSLCISFIITII